MWRTNGLIVGVVAIAWLGVVGMLACSGGKDGTPGTDRSNYTETHGGLNLEMVWVSAGTFQMGSNDSEASSDENPVHTVNLNGFWLGKYEVTQRQYEALMGTNLLLRFKGPDNPVETVSWEDAVTFCRKLSQATGKTYTLPSEAQWEYACRAGSTAKWCFGSDERQLGEYAWHDANSNYQTHRVGQKRWNAWGLYDMHGNVWEWCQDWYHDSYSGSPTDGSSWETPTGRFRVIRGGYWFFRAANCRSAGRYGGPPDGRFNFVGFRLARTP
jgi:formylglycine-generating enzyme required for sulfatase activity